MESKEKIEFAGLPLAVYREIVAHLRQVEGVKADLIPQSSQVFDYHQSQVGGLWFCFASNSSLQTQQRVQQILAFYRNRYGV